MKISDNHEYQRWFIVAGERFTSRREANIRATQLMGQHGPSFVETFVMVDGKIVFHKDNSIHLGRKDATDVHEDGASADR